MRRHNGRLSHTRSNRHDGPGWVCCALMADPPQTKIARSMSLLLAGAALLAIDLTVGADGTEAVTTWEGPDAVTETGFLIDVFPDELGAVLLALAFLPLRRVASGALRAWFALLIGVQSLVVIVALGSHRPQEVVAQEGFSFDWRESLELITIIVAGWSLTALAGQLNFTTSRWRWRRFALWATFGHLGMVGLLALFTGLLGAQAATWTPAQLTAATMTLAGLSLALQIALAYLGIAACLAMRAEAKAA